MIRKRIAWAVFLFIPAAVFAGSNAVKLSQAKELLQKGDYTKAAKTAERVYRASKKNTEPAERADSAAVLIVSYRALQKDPKAEKILREVESRSDAVLLRLTGSQLSRHGQYHDAERLLTKSLKVDWDEAETHAELGRLYNVLGRRDKAAEAFEKSLERKPDSFWIRMELAKLYQLLGRSEEAQKVYRGLENAASSDRAYYIMLGYSLSGLGEPQQADAAFQKGSEVNPNDPLAQHHLATQLEKEGRLAQAESTYKKSVELFERGTGSQPEESLLPLHHLGDLYLKQKRFGEAESIAQKIESLRPRLPKDVPWERVVIRPVQIYGGLRKDAKAESLVRAALAEPPSGRFDRLILLIELSRILQRQGRTEEARSAARKSVRWFLESPLELERKKEALRVSDLLTETLESLALDAELGEVAEYMIGQWEGFLDHSDLARQVSGWIASLRRSDDKPSLDAFSHRQLLDLFQTSTGLELSYFRPMVDRFVRTLEKQGKKDELEDLVRELETIAYRLLEDHRLKNREEFIGRLLELFPIFEAAGKRDEALLLQKWVPLVIIKLPDKSDAAGFLVQIGGYWQRHAAHAAPDRLYRKALVLYEESPRPKPSELLNSFERISEYYLGQRSWEEAKSIAMNASRWKDRLPPEDRQKLAEFAVNLRQRIDVSTGSPGR